MIVLLAGHPKPITVGQFNTGKCQITPGKQFLDGNTLLMAKCHEGIALQTAAIRNQSDLTEGDLALDRLVMARWPLDEGSRQAKRFALDSQAYKVAFGTTVSSEMTLSQGEPSWLSR